MLLRMGRHVCERVGVQIHVYSVVNECIVSASMYLPSTRLFKCAHRRWCHLPLGRVCTCIFGHGCVTLLSVVCLQVSHPTQCSGFIQARKHVHPCIPVTARSECVCKVSVFTPVCAFRVRGSA